MQRRSNSSVESFRELSFMRFTHQSLCLESGVTKQWQVHDRARCSRRSTHLIPRRQYWVFFRERETRDKVPNGMLRSTVNVVPTRYGCYRLSLLLRRLTNELCVGIMISKQIRNPNSPFPAAISEIQSSHATYSSAWFGQSKPR